MPRPELCFFHNYDLDYKGHNLYKDVEEAKSQNEQYPELSFFIKENCPTCAVISHDAERLGTTVWQENKWRDVMTQVHKNSRQISKQKRF